ncbi:hypothetical protein ACEPAG_3301 [Sanghuangporus baumii]
MGSPRRISLNSAHSQQRQQNQTRERVHAKSPVSGIPPVPSIPSHQDIRSDSLAKEPSTISQYLAVEAIHGDAASPVASQPRNWPSAGTHRRSGE